MTRFLVEGDDGAFYPVTNLFDATGNDTTDPARALSMVVRLADDSWLTASTEEIDIITVH